MAQFDQSFEAQPPSEKQFEYAQNLALQTSTAMPDDVATDGRQCSAFIEEMLNKVPPTMKQLNFAQSLADKAGLKLPPEVRHRAT